jgi:hypothetical protein
LTSTRLSSAAGLRHVRAQLLDADARLLELAPRRQPLVEQALHAPLVDLGDFQRGLRRRQLGQYLLALRLQSLEQLRIVVDDAHDRDRRPSPGAVADVPLLDTPGDERVDLLHAVVRD